MKHKKKGKPVRRNIVLVILTVILVAAIFTVSGNAAKKRTIPIAFSDFTTYTPSDNEFGNYYKLRLDTPSGIVAEDLDMAVLEFVVDVGSKLRGDWEILDADSNVTIGFIDNTPSIEIYGLKTECSGEVDIRDLEISSRVVRPLSIGPYQRVVVDVTAIIKSYVRTPTKNHGLIIGSLTGMRNGDFVIKNNAFGNGNAAEVRLYYTQRRTCRF